MLEKAYDPALLEAEWYEKWESNGYFAPSGKNDPYCIMIPPPNVTGSLHMGHAFQQTLMDVLIRYHRMKGRNTLWQVGTDHAGIATQMVVERQLLLEKISRHDLGRSAFVERVWQWKGESGGNITRQLRRMGASVDWTKERFTMDEGLSNAVQEVFIRLYEEKLIYRGKRLVNWDPVLLTAVSDLEVEYEEEKGSLWHIRYPIVESNDTSTIESRNDNDSSESIIKDYIVVATTRPETMLGDVAVAVNPKDERFAHLIGKKVQLPLTGRTIPIISDDYVDPEFGTGCVKITPAHDFNDYAMAERHQLPKINIFTNDSKLNENAPKVYQGLDRFKARDQIVEDLKEAKLLEKIEPHTLKVPRGDRSGAIIEPMLTDQWYVKVESLAKPAIEVVENKKVQFVPENWSKTYFEWMRNIQDWCISRQLWWGHRIPAWYDDNGNIYVGRSEEEIRKKHQLPSTLILKQDEDVLDTWFSSALWPFSTLGWPEETKDYKTFYPTNVLITGFDIIFFWVARMIMFGLKFTDQIPFHEVYINGLIVDHNGQKMSKTKGNVLDPLDIIDGIDLESLVIKRTTGLMQPKLAEEIEKNTRKEFPKGIDAHGTDALRFTYCALATHARYIRFDLARVEGYRHFCNKLWNAARYVLMSTESYAEYLKENNDKKELLTLSLPDQWILSRWQQAKENIEKHINTYRFDLAAQTIYEFTWNEYCDWYLELSKPILTSKEESIESQGIQGSHSSKMGTCHTLISVLEEMLRVIHPFMPYITEGIWQKVKSLAGKTGESIMIEPYPSIDESKINPSAEEDILWIQAMILGVRNIRGEMNISPGKPLPVLLQNGSELDKKRSIEHERLLKSLAKMESITWLSSTDSKPPSATALVGQMEILIPMAGLIDTKAEINRLQKELDKLNIDLTKINTKLENPNFIKNAPQAVVEQDQKRVVELKTAIQKLHDRISEMKEISTAHS